MRVSPTSSVILLGIPFIVLLVLLTSLLPLSVNAAALQRKETEIVEGEIQHAEQTEWY